jgi:hypothetical protein
MASNGKPQFVRQVFSQQSNGAAGEAVNASVRQDKARKNSARIASAQPAVVKKVMRAHESNTGTARSKNNPTPKRKAVHLDLWVNPIVKAELQRIAKQEGLSMSKAGAAFLERALQQNIDMTYHALLKPAIKSAIREEMHKYSKPIAILLARSVFASEQTRSLTTNILGRQPGVTEDLLKNILAMSQRAAKSNITRKTPQLTDLINAIEQWLLTDFEEQEPKN